MKTWKDPFPPTPEGFHLRVEATLGALEKREARCSPSRKKALVLVAAILAALAMVTAVAAVAGSARLKDWLSRKNLGEVADLVREVHLGDTDADGFGFTVDELLWEDDDLYISYSLRAPDDGSYMVALYTPTLNAEKLTYDGKGFTTPKFFDAEGASLLLLGGRHANACTELLTFAVDPRLRRNPDNRLRFSAVLLRTDLNPAGRGDWTDLLDPPRYIRFQEDWRADLAGEELANCDAQYVEWMDTMASTLGDGALTLDELISTGHVEYVAEREIDMGLDGTKLNADVLYNDVKEHDFDRLGLHIHVDRFRMTRLGVEIACTVSAPGAKGATNPLNTFAECNWRFCTPEGKSLGHSLGGSGGSGLDTSKDKTPTLGLDWREEAFIPLQGVDQILFAPCEYVDDPDGGNHPVFDLENAIALTPIYSEDAAGGAPTPTIEPGELDLSH